MKMQSPAAQRNIVPIGNILADWLPQSGYVLELASGSGEHGLAFAQRFPHLTWQPSDPDASARASIAAWLADVGTKTMLPPLAIDAASIHWPVERADAVVAINMVHISPWSATLGLMAGAARVLGPGGVLILYGPYFETDIATAPSNAAFDHSLKCRNSAWGIRHLDDVRRAAAKAGLIFEDRCEMPTNNLMLLFRKGD